MSIHDFIPVMTAYSWPITILVLALLFQKSVRELVERVHTIKATSKGVEMLMNKLEKEGQLPLSSRAELSGLSANDIWALNDFASEKITTCVDQMTPMQRVAARTLLDSKLLAVTGEGPARKVTVAPLGRLILETAKSIPL